MTTDFASLHTHGHHSLLDGYSTVDEYIERALEIGMPGLGWTDHGNLFAIFEFLKKTKSADITGLPGCEFYVAPENPEGAFCKSPVFYGPNGKKAGRNDVSSNGAYLHLTVWAYTNKGLYNLFKLSTLSNDPARYYQSPRIDFDLLAEHSEGLIVATGCPSSEISTRFLLGQDDKANAYASRLVDVFGKDRVFVEIMDHSMEIDLERNLLPKQMELAKRFGLGLLATNDSHYAHPEDSLHHEELLAKQSGSRMDEKPFDQGGTRFALSGSGYYLKSGAEMERIFDPRDFPGALSNSMKVLEMAEDLSLQYDPDLRPTPKIPEKFAGDEVAYYKSLISAGFKERYGNSPPEVVADAKARNKKEFRVMDSSGYIGYMLVVRDYIKWTKDNFSTRDSDGDVLAFPVGGGRGSVGGSIHAYELGISEIDPVRFDLVFERFLSEGRGPTYEIVYDDGSVEQVIASASYEVERDGEKSRVWTHQLELGDTVIMNENG